MAVITLMQSIQAEVPNKVARFYHEHDFEKTYYVVRDYLDFVKKKMTSEEIGEMMANEVSRKP